MPGIPQNSGKCEVCGTHRCGCFCQETERCGCGSLHCPAWGPLLGRVILSLVKAGSFLEVGFMHRLVNKTVNAAIENLLGVSVEGMEHQKCTHGPDFYIYMLS